MENCIDPFEIGEHVLTRPTTPHILLVNGPPEAGKDTVGQVLADNYKGRVYVTKMAKALKERTHSLYGLFNSVTREPLEHDFFEDCKNQPHRWFFGLSPREAYIAVAERLMKPLHGERFWGELLVEDIGLHGSNADLIVVTDSGFSQEAQPLIEKFGAHRISLIHLMRKGKDFSSDSRSYISLPDCDTYPLHNDGNIVDLALALSRIVPNFKIGYSIEVQLPMLADLQWFEQGTPRPSMEQALAAIESLRQQEYQNRVWRVRVGKTIVKTVMPGDEPLVNLA